MGVSLRRGFPRVRPDRRGIGDSTGENREFETTAEDLAAAAAAFRENAKVERIVAFGNCDAASALAMFHQQAGIDRMVLANPWTIEPTDNLPPAAAIRARYAERLRDPREWLRLLRGGVNILGVLRGLAKISKKAPEQPAGLPTRVAAGLAQSECPATILLAKGDNTAIAFRECWESDGFAAVRERVAVEELDSNSHSFARAADKDWLYNQLKAALTSTS